MQNNYVDMQENCIQKSVKTFQKNPQSIKYHPHVTSSMLDATYYVNMQLIFYFF